MANKVILQIIYEAEQVFWSKTFSSSEYS